MVGQKVLVGCLAWLAGWPLSPGDSVPFPPPQTGKRSGGGEPRVSSLFMGLGQCYLSLGHVKVAHPVFTGRLHRWGRRNLRRRLPPDSAGPRHR